MNVLYERDRQYVNLTYDEICKYRTLIFRRNYNVSSEEFSMKQIRIFIPRTSLFLFWTDIATNLRI